MQFIEAPNISTFLFMPVTEKIWQQHELWDGTYTFDDLLDIHEALWVKNRNMQKVIESLKDDKNE